MEEAGFLQRHPWLVYVFMLPIRHTSAPLFSVAVSGFEGLDARSGAASAPPTFHVILRVENKDFLPRHCFKEGSAVVELDGVPLARADRLGGFCVPGRIAVDVLFVATGGGLGLPDAVYDRVCGGGVPSLVVRVRLDGDAAVKTTSDLGRLTPMLVRCTMTLDGLPSFDCRRFLMLERGINNF